MIFDVLSLDERELLFVLTCGVVGAAGMFTGDLIGYRRGVRDGIALHPKPDFERGVRSGQWMIASFLAGSNIPAVRAAGRDLLKRWGK